MLTSELRRFAEPIHVAGPNGTCRWLGLAAVKQQLEPASLAESEVCRLRPAGVQVSMLEDIHTIASPEHLTDIELLTKLMQLPEDIACQPQHQQAAWLMNVLASGKITKKQSSAVLSTMKQQLAQALWAALACTGPIKAFHLTDASWWLAKAAMVFPGVCMKIISIS